MLNGLAPPKEPIYLFAGNMAEAEKIARHQGYSSDEYVFIGKEVHYFMRSKNRKIYFCGSWYERQDVSIARRLASKQNWQVFESLPPRKP